MVCGFQAFLTEIFVAEDIVLVTDEIYEHILFPPHKHICPATLPGMRERTVVVQSISKTASATGWRIGWIIAPPAITLKVRAVHDSIVIQAPTPLQKGAERFLCVANPPPPPRLVVDLDRGTLVQD